MVRIESPLHNQASAIPESDFNTRVRRNRRALGYFHFQESRRRSFPQPFLPDEKIRAVQAATAAKLGHTRILVLDLGFAITLARISLASVGAEL
jgi:hypothetical protein